MITPVADIILNLWVRQFAEWTMRDMARKAGDQWMADCHDDRAQMLAEVLRYLEDER